MDMIGKVRRMRLRDQLSLSEIAKRTGLSHNTVKKWLRAPSDVVPEYERVKLEGKLTAFEPTLHQALTTDSHRPKQGRRSGRALFAQIQAQGYRGGYSAVTDYIRRWRVESAASPTKAFVPMSFEPGEAFQFDWSVEAMVVGGVFYNVQVAHLKLCASRAFWLVAYPSQGHEMLFDAHTRSFQALGGVTRRGIYDNMRTAVDKVQRGKQRTVNARFAAMCSHYLFDPDFCNVASGWEKGVVEKNVQDSRRRIWIEAATRCFGSFIELNAWLSERCRSVWGRHHAPDPPAVHRGRDVGVGEASPHVHAGPLRRLRRVDGPGQQHLLGGRRAQPLLCAVRVGRPHRQHPRLSRTNRCSGRRRRRGQPCPAAGQRPDQLRLAALH